MVVKLLSEEEESERSEFTDPVQLRWYSTMQAGYRKASLLDRWVYLKISQGILNAADSTVLTATL